MAIPRKWHLSQILGLLAFVSVIAIVIRTWLSTGNGCDHENASGQVRPKFAVDKAGFWSGINSVSQHAHDGKLARCLLDFFHEERAENLLDLGAGMGFYASFLIKHGLPVSCYDGNPDTQEISLGRCAVLDLSRPIRLAEADWVLSLEVGEHIRQDFESVYISNIQRTNKRGAVVSWAVPGQGGMSHVNERDNSEVASDFTRAGYWRDGIAEKVLRQCATLPWFKNTIMVFRRNVTQRLMSD